MAGAQASDTRLTRIFSGRPARGILNDAMRARWRRTRPRYPPIRYRTP